MGRIDRAQGNAIGKVAPTTASVISGRVFKITLITSSIWHV
jgi:hypothetical protein